MDRKEEELKVIVSAAERANGSDVKTELVGTLYRETKWGPDKDHPIKFEDIEDPEERRFFEGKEHLEEVYPGVTKGMLVNFSVNGALFDPVSQTPADMQNNYEAMAAAMSKKGFSYDKMADLLGALRNMFGFGGLPFINERTMFYLLSYGLFLIIACVAATPLPGKTVTRVVKRVHGEKVESVGLLLFLFTVLLLSTAFLASDAFNPFLYFRF